MHEFEFQLESSVHDLYIPRQKLPLNFVICRVQQVCVNKYRREKKCNMTCYFTQQVKENMMGKIKKKNLKQHMAIQNAFTIISRDKYKLIR